MICVLAVLTQMWTVCHAADEMDLFVLILSFLTACAGFKVNAPASRVVAVRGQPAILGCEFPPDSTPDLASLVVTWQRVEDSRVVHSFYYGVDQLSRQSSDYHDRTSLFVSELQRGNASLRIQPVGPRDVGGYLCTVSNSKGTDKAQVQLEYGAFYKEPQLSINANCSGVTLRYETEGFPKPEIRWFGEHGETLSVHTELREETDGPDGPAVLYHLKSSYATPSSSLNVTFTLKNQLLDQNLLRPVRITYDGANDCCRSKTTTITVLSVLCFLLILCIIALVIWFRMREARRHQSPTSHPSPTSNGSANGQTQHMLSSLDK